MSKNAKIGGILLFFEMLKWIPKRAMLAQHWPATEILACAVVISYNSCRNRNCPKCQTQPRLRWLAADAKFENWELK
jgi:hypothetical protein